MTTNHIKNLKQLIKGEKSIRNKLFWSMFILSVIFLTVAGAIGYANIKYAQEGTVQVVTRWGSD